MPTSHRLTGTVAACALALITGCSHQAMPPASTSAVADGSQHTEPATPAGSPTLMNPSATQRTPSSAVRPDPSLTTPTIPNPTTATTTALDVAKAWAIAANSTSYLDSEAGSWTGRAEPFVTGAEQAAEREQRSGAGGSTWTLIQAGKCVSNLRHLVAGIPSRDVPTGPDLHIVYVSALAAVSCATGQVQLTPFVAQLTVTRVGGRWLVADVRH